MRVFFLILFLAVLFTECKGNFEDTRCRCTCPNTKYFSSNASSEDSRRYYTKTNINPSFCNPQNVVKDLVINKVDGNHLDAFLANCDCRFESRNTVVVIFVICVMLVLGTYMGFLVLLDPMLRRQRANIPYHRQDDEIEENIFAQQECQASDSSSAISMQMRPRASHSNNVLSKVEAEQNKWKSSVEEQRRKVMTEHTILN